MASGNYPLSPTSPAGIELIAIAARILDMLDSRGYGGILPASWENSESDNAALDGGYEARLYLAVELIQTAVSK